MAFQYYLEVHAPKSPSNTFDIVSQPWLQHVAIMNEGSTVGGNVMHVYDYVEFRLGQIPAAQLGARDILLSSKSSSSIPQ